MEPLSSTLAENENGKTLEVLDIARCKLPIDVISSDLRMKDQHCYVPEVAVTENCWSSYTKRIFSPAILLRPPDDYRLCTRPGSYPTLKADLRVCRRVVCICIADVVIVEKCFDVFFQDRCRSVRAWKVTRGSTNVWPKTQWAWPTRTEQTFTFEVCREIVKLTLQTTESLRTDMLQ